MDPQEFIDECGLLIEMAEELSERAADFASSVIEKLEGMRDWAEEHNHVTEKMETALENMSSGVAAWEESSWD